MAGTCQVYTRAAWSGAVLTLPPAFLECPFLWLLNNPAVAAKQSRRRQTDGHFPPACRAWALRVSRLSREERK